MIQKLLAAGECAWPWEMGGPECHFMRPLGRKWVGWGSGGVGRIMAPGGVHAIIPGICEYVTLSGKRDFAVMVNKDFLNGKIILDYLGRSNGTPEVFMRGT